MTWFRGDDAFPSHPKVRSIPRKGRMAAVGVWAVCGMWSSQHLTDGDVPMGVVEDEGGRRADAEALVKAGLWHAPGHGCPRCPQPAAGHYQFHDWPDYQPTKDKVMAERAATAERVSRHRKRKQDEQGGRPDPESDTGNGVTPTVSNGSSNGHVTMPPARPVPEKLLLTLVSRLAAGDAHEPTAPPAEQIAAWQTLAGARVDLEAEAREYLMRHGDRPARDERGAWLGWLRAARRRTEDAERAAGSGPTPTAPPCPIDGHGRYPATRCPACVREAAPAPNLRALIDATRETA